MLKGRSTQFEGPISQVPPAGNGVYADGKPVAGALGCSVHWFQEHTSLQATAASSRSPSTRTACASCRSPSDGKINEQGYFLSLGSSSSSPKWAGKDDVLYSIDYQRGIDILRWKGKHYVPGKKERRGRMRGTNGVTTPPAPTQAQAAQRDALAARAARAGLVAADLQPRGARQLTRRADTERGAAVWQAAAMALDPRPALRRLAAPRVDAFVRRRYRTLSGRPAPSGDLDRATLQGFRRLVDRAARGEPVPARLDKAVARAFDALARSDLDGSRPSPPIRQAIVDQFHRLYYHSPRRTWKNTRFLGVTVWKSPLDLWLYQELIHDLRPDVIIEAGTKFGGSAYYFARLFDLIGHGQVITIDVEEQPGRPDHPRITYLSGSSADPEIADRVIEMGGGGKSLVVLDSSHRRDHVLAELRLWSTRVPVGSYVVVEDTHAGGHPVRTRHRLGGPWAAVEQFVAENDAFEIDESMHKFFMTFNPRGYLKRVR